LVLNVDQTTGPFSLIRSKNWNSLFQSSKLILTYDVCLYTLRVSQSLPAWVDEINPRGDDSYILTEVTFGNKSKACERKAEVLQAFHENAIHHTISWM
jgi:hypothetical protein